MGRYQAGSKGGSVPLPKGVVDPEKNGPSCEAVLKKGCICGGLGMHYSRGAIQKLFKNGEKQFWDDVNELDTKIQADVGMSCIFWKRGIQFMPLRVRSTTFMAAQPFDASRQVSDVAIFHIV